MRGARARTRGRYELAGQLAAAHDRDHLHLVRTQGAHVAVVVAEEALGVAPVVAGEGVDAALVGVALAGFDQAKARAADALGRSQPAISLQMKRLEELLDAKLLSHEGRELRLTEQGEALAVYARQLLRLNDEAVQNGSRLLSSYRLRSGETIWIITEADRSASTLLLPSEY